MSIIERGLVSRGLLTRGLIRRGLIGDKSEPEFLDAESNLFNTSELFTDAELWYLAPMPSGLLHSTELLTDTALIGDN